MGNYLKNSGKTVEVGVEVFLTKSEDYYVAVCPALNLSTFGETVEETKEAFHEVMELFIEDITERQMLEKALLDLGWTLRKLPQFEFKPPTVNKTEIPQVPNLLQQKFSETFCVPV